MTILVAQVDQRPASIPPWVVDLQSFRRWACSDEFPQSGWYSHLDGDLWVDTSMETVTHNQIKGEIDSELLRSVKIKDMGKFFGDRMLLTHETAGLSTEPDGMFVSHDSLAARRVELKQREKSVEVVGTPDMVLEVVSQSSRQKDRVVLRELYHKAKVPEYWLVESERGLTLELLTWQPQGYVASPSQDGWVQSPVFGKSFRLTTSTDRSGLTVYYLESR